MVRRCINVHGRLCKLIQLANLHTPYLEAQMAKRQTHSDIYSFTLKTHESK